MLYYSLDEFLQQNKKVKDVDPSDILTFSDYDLTLAAKDLVDFDKAELTPEQHFDLAAYASATARLIVVTARGERSCCRYLTQHGEMPNTSLASNSGYVYRDYVSPLSDQKILSIPGYAPGELEAVVHEGVYPILNELRLAFQEVSTDHRELCGAAIYNFLGDDKSTLHTQFHAMLQDLREKTPAHIREHLLFAAKHRESEILDPSDVCVGGIRTQGYVDIKPRGMEKGHVVSSLLTHYGMTLTQNPFVVVAGDSEPDYDMMVAVARTVPPERRLFISVGNGLCCCDTKRRAAGGETLVDVYVEGPQDTAITGFHELLAGLGRTRPIKSPGHVTYGVWNKVSNAHRVEP